MPQRENDCTKTVDERQEIVEKETIVRHTHEEGDENVAHNFTRSETKVENDDDVGEEQ